MHIRSILNCVMDKTEGIFLLSFSKQPVHCQNCNEACLIHHVKNNFTIVIKMTIFYIILKLQNELAIFIIHIAVHLKKLIMLKSEYLYNIDSELYQ